MGGACTSPAVHQFSPADDRESLGIYSNSARPQRANYSSATVEDSNDSYGAYVAAIGQSNNTLTTTTTTTTATSPRRDTSHAHGDTSRDSHAAGGTQPDKQQQDNAVKPGKGTMSWRQVLAHLADKDLWEGVKREDRKEWQHYCRRADDLVRKPRKPIGAELVTSIVEGDMGHLDISKLPSAQPKVAVFVSSTFTDTEAERNLLMRDVYPFLRSVCRRLGIDFGTVDMRWGVSDDTTNEHGTIKMCVNEIKRCVRQSAGPAFLCILSHKYGYRPLPPSIEQSEFESMVKHMDNTDKNTALMKSYYNLDDNAIPPEYVLKPQSADKTAWWADSDFIQAQMRDASVECFGEESEKCTKYHVSVTETEIQTGVFKNPNFAKQVLFIERNLSGVTSDRHKDRRMIDMVGENIDEYAQKKLRELRREKVEATVTDDILLQIDYDEAEIEECTEYIKEVADHVCRSLVENILDNYEQHLHVEDNPTFQEAMQHRELAIDKSSLFIGRENELDTIIQYVKGDEKAPLVVHGKSGCGKTALMAVASRKTKDELSNFVLILRFLGTTGRSGSARALLLSVCKQITQAYGKDPSHIPESYKELKKHLRVCMTYAQPNQPLVLYLDSLDQLSNEDFALNLSWLTLDEPLLDNVKVVVSTLPTNCLEILKRFIDDSNFIEVRELTKDEGPNIFKNMLALENRRITEKQENVVYSAFMNCPLPLFIRLAADIAIRWRSYDDVTANDIADDMPGLITMLFERMEARYGGMFVHHALSYITAAKYGLSLTELEDILSCDDDLLDSVFKWWTPPFRRIPPLLWARVRNDLGIYLAERGTDGLSTYGWYHRQFLETARNRYLLLPFGEDQEPFIDKAHEAVADYFEGKFETGKLYPTEVKEGSPVPKMEDRKIPKQPIVISGDRTSGRKINKRKLSELPYHLIEIQDWSRFLNLAMDLKYIEAKFEAGVGYECLSEFIEATKVSRHETLKELTRFVGSNLSYLLREPEAVYQVASQLASSHPVGKLADAMQPEDMPKELVVNTKEDDTDDPCEMTLQGHTETVRCCNVSPTGEQIVSTGDDGTLRIWDTLTGAETVTLTSLPLPVWPGEDEPMQLMLHPVNPCCFNRTGDVIANGTETGDVMLWDTAGAQIKVAHTDNNAVTFIAYSHDNKSIATSFKNGNVYIWDAETLEREATVDIGVETTGLDYSPDDKILAVAILKGLAIVNATSKTLKGLEYDLVSPYKEGDRASRGSVPLTLCVTFHPSGNQVMTGGADSAVTIWDPHTNVLVDKLRSHSAWIWSIQFTKAGDFMFTGSSDRSMKIWRHDNGNWTAFATIGGHSHRVSMVSMETKAEEKLVTASLDRSLKVWNVNALKEGRVPPVGGLHYNCIEISPLRDVLVTSQGWARACAFHSMETDSKCGSTPGHSGFIRNAAFRSDGLRLFVLDHGHTGGYETGAAAKAKLRVCSVPDGNTATGELDVHGPTSMAVSDKYVLTGTMNGEILLFHAGEYREVNKWAWKDTISTVAISSVHDIVAASTGKECRLWRVSETNCDQIADLPEFDSSVYATAFTPDGRKLIVGEDSGTITAWNIADTTPALLKTLTAHTSYIKDIKFSPGGAYMVTSADLSMRIWDMADMTLKCAYYAPVNCAVFSEENLVIAGEATGNRRYLKF